MRHLLVAIALTVFAASCASDPEQLIDLQDDTTISSTSTTTTTTSTTTPTSTTATTTSTSTTSTTTTTSIAVQTELTVSEPGTIQADIETAFWKMEAIRLAAVTSAPFDREASRVDEVFAEPLLSDLVAFREESEARREGLRLTSGGLEVHLIEIGLSDGGGLATVRACYVNDLDRYNLDTGESINDEVWTIEELYLFAETETTWLAISVQTEASSEGVSGCALDV